MAAYHLSVWLLRLDGSLSAKEAGRWLPASDRGRPAGGLCLLLSVGVSIDGEAEARLLNLALMRLASSPISSQELNTRGQTRAVK